MRTFLDQMKDIKLKEVAMHQQHISEKELHAQVSLLDPAPSFSDAICRKSIKDPLSIIAEVKAKAPGRENVSSLDAVSVLKDYEQGGVSAVSVLTDESYFGGSLETLDLLRTQTQLPLLHKEFIVTRYQLLQGRLRGSSAALILAYYFDKRELFQMVEFCKSIGIQAVVECSLEEELEHALDITPDILMINNRPIAAIPENPTQSYQKGSVQTSVSWWKKEPELRLWKEGNSRTLISASCIDSHEDVQHLHSLPYDAILIGNALMVAPDRATLLKELQTPPSSDI